MQVVRVILRLKKKKKKKLASSNCLAALNCKTATKNVQEPQTGNQEEH